jgi:hypothetical protein
MFAIIGVVSALGLLIYDRFIAHQLEAQQQKGAGVDVAQA